MDRPSFYVVSNGRLVLHLEPAAEGGYVVTSPFESGLITEAETIEEAFANAEDATRTLAAGRPDGWRDAIAEREQTRADVLAALAELGRARPDWRLGQTMANLAMTAGRLDAGAVWDLEDVEALDAARELLAQSAREAAATK